MSRAVGVLKESDALDAGYADRLRRFVKAKAPWFLERARIVKSAIDAIDCYAYDLVSCVRHMHWRRRGAQYWKISSELIYMYHKLEKGLCIPGRRFFGADAAMKTCRLMREWRSKGMPTDAAVYVAAVETLRAYRTRLNETPPPTALAASLLSTLDECIASTSVVGAPTPLKHQLADPASVGSLEALCVARRSVRAFSDAPVERALVERAIRIAQLSPSACNRQPWRVHLYDDRATIASLLKLQNGNRGFGHLIPKLAIITADAHSYSGATERNQPFLDGGLFTMSFILGLQAQGLASCCLNWCVRPKTDKKVRRIAGISPSEKIMTFLAIGVAADEALVPRSARRSDHDVIVEHVVVAS